jgi:hypothetical protein
VSEPFGTSVEELVSSIKQRGTRMPSDIGAFIALETVEAIVSEPASVSAKDVRIREDGMIGVAAAERASDEEAARSVVELLRALMDASGASAPKAIRRLLDEGPSSSSWDLPSLKDDLEASLVPLNRAAARRVLSRMLREAKRAPPARPSVEKREPAKAEPVRAEAKAERREPAKPAEKPAAQPANDEQTIQTGGDADATIDSQLDDFLDASEKPHAAALDSELDALLDAPPAKRSTPPKAEPRAAMRPPAGGAHDEESTVREAAAPAPAEETPAIPLRKVPSDRPTERPPKRAGPAEDLGDQLDSPERKTSVLPWALAFVAIVAATAAAGALMRPDLVDSLLGRPAPPPPDAGPSPEEIARERRARFGTLTVHATPERAQVLLYVGRGPAVAEDLPVGVAHEFVAIADGQAPTRAIVPADTEWESTPDGPRYELAMQAGSEPMEELDLGPSGLPRDVGSPSGLGQVRVVTNPPGAKVYVLVGFAPDVVVENVPADEALELLVYARGHVVERVVVGPSDWHVSEDGTKRAEVTVDLVETSQD